MTVVESYAAAVMMCVITMFCWGSWANTQKLASKEWRFELFYWDYAIGVLLFALVLAFTLGSTGSAGRTIGSYSSPSMLPASRSASCSMRCTFRTRTYAYR